MTGDGNGALGRLANVYGSRRYAVLFYTLLLTIAASPLLTALGFDGDLLQIFLALNLLVALLGLPDRGWRLLLMLLAAVAMGLRAVPLSGVGVKLATGALVVTSVLALLAAISATRFALRSRQITREQIYAALSAYLLAGLFFGVLHWAVGIAWPGSFGEAGAGDAPGAFRLTTAVYYSFVTLATLGYGDVVPRTDVARGLAVLEAVAGQFYMAVLIAGLVGARIQASGQGSEGSREADQPPS